MAAKLSLTAYIADENSVSGTIAPAADHLEDLGTGAVDEAHGLGSPLAVVLGTDVEAYEDRASALRTLANGQAGP